jgi:RNA polymerase sigma-70 factor, ECF subfamily
VRLEGVQAPVEPPSERQSGPAVKLVAGPAPAAPKGEVALRDLLDNSYASVWRLLRRFGVPEPKADDALQEVFWTFARRRTAIKPGSEAAFLYGIAIRVAARVRSEREPTLLPSDALDAIADEQPSAEDLLDERRARDLLDTVLDAMDDKLREVFVLFELEEIEIPEIAEILEIPVGTVGSRLRRARAEFSAIAKRVRARSAFAGGSR